MKQKLHIVAGSDLTDSQFTAFKELLLSGGQINIAENVLDKNIKNAEALAFYRNDDDVLVGIGAVKNPQESYIRKVFNFADVADKRELYQLEVGYFVTEPEYTGRGICSSLLNYLIEYMGTGANYFATTKSEAMKKVFTNTGFTKLGQSWSANSGNILELYIYNQ